MLVHHKNWFKFKHSFSSRMFLSGGPTLKLPAPASLSTQDSYVSKGGPLGGPGASTSAFILIRPTAESPSRIPVYKWCWELGGWGRHFGHLMGSRPGVN